MGRVQKSLNSFKCSTFIGRLPSDGAASLAVKGLMDTPEIPDRSSATDIQSDIPGPAWGNFPTIFDTATGSACLKVDVDHCYTPDRLVSGFLRQLHLSCLLVNLIWQNSGTEDWLVWASSGNPRKTFFWPKSIQLGDRSARARVQTHIHPRARAHTHTHT